MLSDPIRANLPIITKFQDFWNQAKQITTLFKELKPLARDDRELLWKRFNELCAEVKVKQQSEYGTLESLSKGHYDEIIEAGRASCSARKVPHLLIYGNCSTVGRLSKRPGIFSENTNTRCWPNTKKPRLIGSRGFGESTMQRGRMSTRKSRGCQAESEAGIKKNLEANRERYRKAAGALENFQIGAANLRAFIDSCREPEKVAKANAQLAETQARIKDIAEGMHKLEKWIEEDERALGVE